VFFIFVVCANHENIFKTKMSRSTVVARTILLVSYIQISMQFYPPSSFASLDFIAPWTYYSSKKENYETGIIFCKA